MESGFGAHMAVLSGGPGGSGTWGWEGGKGRGDEYSQLWGAGNITILAGEQRLAPRLWQLPWKANISATLGLGEWLWVFHLQPSCCRPHPRGPQGALWGFLLLVQRLRWSQDIQGKVDEAVLATHHD